jgi:hypothetical protein
MNVIAKSRHCYVICVLSQSPFMEKKWSMLIVDVQCSSEKKREIDKFKRKSTPHGSTLFEFNEFARGLQVIL